MSYNYCFLRRNALNGCSEVLLFDSILFAKQLLRSDILGVGSTLCSLDNSAKVGLSNIVDYISFAHSIHGSIGLFFYINLGTYTPKRSRYYIAFKHNRSIW